MIVQQKGDRIITCHICQKGPPCTFYNFLLSETEKVKICGTCKKSLIHKAKLIRGLPDTTQ